MHALWIAADISDMCIFVESPLLTMLFIWCLDWQLPRENTALAFSLESLETVWGLLYNAAGRSRMDDVSW